MKAIQIGAYGEHEVLKLSEVPKPEIQSHEVLIKVAAAGMNPIDWKVRKGFFAEIFPFSLPFTLGWDVAGTVVEVGSNVSRFKMGDEVFGLVNFPEVGGTCAEYVSARAVQPWYTPAKFSMEQAAAFPLAGLTAWQTLFEIGKLKPNQTVLIHAAAGGVGHLAVQFAKWKGAHVIATASKNNHDFLAKLGADRVIDYHQADLKAALKDTPVDLVLDGVGGQTTLDSLEVMQEGGILISLPAPVSPEVEQKAQAKQIKTPWHIVYPSAVHLSDMANLIDDGLITLELTKTFSFESVAEAHKMMEEGHVRGKVVLKNS